MYTKISSSSVDDILHNAKTSLPPSLQAPFMTALRAYAVSWTLTTAPGVLGLVVKLCLALMRRQQHNKLAVIRHFLFQQLPKILKKSIYQNGFPWLITGAFASHRFITYILKRWSHLLQQHQQQQHRQQQQQSSISSYTKHTIANNDSRSICTSLFDNDKQRHLVMFISAALSMLFVRRAFPNTKTTDFTFFTLVRAIDVYAHRAYQSPAITRIAPAWIMEYGSVIAFTLACTEIMYSWFYEPARLPRGYSMWITKMAQMDSRLLQALRSLRNGTLIYGKDTGLNDLLGNYCVEIGLPYEAGLPTRGRLPCRVLHGGQPWGCEWHALTRFVKGFVKVFPLYLTVHLTPPLLFKTNKLKQNPVSNLQHILKSSVRSSTFLASFITIIWYSICLTRTRIGHQLLGVNQTRLDGTLAPFIGSALCGVSLMIENRHRRGEMALYVIPRALFSLTEHLIGSWHNRGRWWEPKMKEAAEIVVFAASVMTVLNAMYEDKDMVRSSARGLLSWIMKYELAYKQGKEKQCKA